MPPPSEVCSSDCFTSYCNFSMANMVFNALNAEKNHPSLHAVPSFPGRRPHPPPAPPAAPPRAHREAEARQPAPPALPGPHGSCQQSAESDMNLRRGAERLRLLPDRGRISGGPVREGGGVRRVDFTEVECGMLGGGDSRGRRRQRDLGGRHVGGRNIFIKAPWFGQIPPNFG